MDGDGSDTTEDLLIDVAKDRITPPFNFGWALSKFEVVNTSQPIPKSMDIGFG